MNSTTVVAYVSDGDIFCSDCKPDGADHNPEVGVIFVENDMRCGTMCEGCNATWHPCRESWDQAEDTVDSILNSEAIDFLDYVLPGSPTKNDCDVYCDELDLNSHSWPLDVVVEFAEHSDLDFDNSSGVMSALYFLAASGAHSQLCSTIDSMFKNNEIEWGDHSAYMPEGELLAECDNYAVTDRDEELVAWRRRDVEMGGHERVVWQEEYEVDEDELDVEGKLSLDVWRKREEEEG